MINEWGVAFQLLYVQMRVTIELAIQLAGTQPVTVINR
jgi:hypothetical protein